MLHIPTRKEYSRESEDSVMNSIQNKILTIMRVVDEICERNGLTYYAIGGTCIGALRHHGFIPWDDDLDIAVPIEDWDRFWNIMERELPHEYRIYCGNEIRHYRYIFNKIHDSRTSFIEKAEEKFPDAYKGIFIDVMPIAGIPETKSKRDRFYRKILWFSRLNYIMRYPLSEMDSWKKIAFWPFVHLLEPLFSFHYFSDRWIKLLKTQPFYESKFTGYTWWANASDKLCFPFDFFNGTKRYSFEGINISCPINSDGYLKKQFGNYMEFPPEDQRIDHHQVFVSINVPYNEYNGEEK